MIKKKTPTLASVTEGQQSLLSKYGFSASVEDASAADEMNEFDALKWRNWVAQREILTRSSSSQLHGIVRRIYGTSGSQLNNNREAPELLAA